MLNWVKVRKASRLSLMSEGSPNSKLRFCSRSVAATKIYDDITNIV